MYQTEKEQYIMENNTERRKQLFVEYRVHKKRASAFYEIAKEPPKASLTFCFHLQQVQPLPRTLVGDAFYSHQIRFYAFFCVGISSRNPTFYVWTEDMASTGSTEIDTAFATWILWITLTYTGSIILRRMRQPE